MTGMPVTQILAVLAGLGLLVSCALIPLRMGWGRSGSAQPASGGWWILSLVAVTFWAFALSSSLKAHAKTTTALALKELKVVSAAEILKEPDAWRNVPDSSRTCCATKSFAACSPASARSASKPIWRT